MQIIVQTPSPVLNESRNFYEKLGFKIATLNESTFAIAEKLIIELNSNKFSRAGVKIISPQYETILKTQGLDDIATKTDVGHLITSPAGCPIYLIDNSPIESVEIEAKKAIIGNYGGFSIETNNIQNSTEFWTKFGFIVNGGNLDHGWVSLINEETKFTISLMTYQCCPHLFFNPSLSFFNGKDNLEIIAKIRQLDILISQEITEFNSEGIVDNIIIRDPGGLGYFIFND